MGARVTIERGPRSPGRSCGPLLTKRPRRAPDGLDVPGAQPVERALAVKTMVARKEEPRFRERGMAAKQRQDLGQPLDHAALVELPRRVQVAPTTDVDGEQSAAKAPPVDTLTRDPQTLADLLGGQGAAFLREELVTMFDPAQARLRQGILGLEQPRGTGLAQSHEDGAGPRRRCDRSLELGSVESKRHVPDRGRGALDELTYLDRCMACNFVN